MNFLKIGSIWEITPYALSLFIALWGLRHLLVMNDAVKALQDKTDSFTNAMERWKNVSFIIWTLNAFAVADVVVNHKKLNCSFKLYFLFFWLVLVSELHCVLGCTKGVLICLYDKIASTWMGHWAAEDIDRYRYIDRYFFCIIFLSFSFLAVYSNQVMGNNNAQKLSSFSSLLCSSPLRHPTCLINCETVFR